MRSGAIDTQDIGPNTRSVLTFESVLPIGFLGPLYPHLYIFSPSAEDLYIFRDLDILG